MVPLKGSPVLGTVLAVDCARPSGLSRRLRRDEFVGRALAAADADPGASGGLEGELLAGPLLFPFTIFRTSVRGPIVRLPVLGYLLTPFPVAPYLAQRDPPSGTLAGELLAGLQLFPFTILGPHYEDLL